ncbi:hypothetical protein F5887DRAFT_1013646 [Amanita rubescens]|nr:hypothetical protein F5887DRAFT_1013646 [Amanita rubescens]
MMYLLLLDNDEEALAICLFMLRSIANAPQLNYALNHLLVSNTLLSPKQFTPHYDTQIPEYLFRNSLYSLISNASRAISQCRRHPALSHHNHSTLKSFVKSLQTSSQFQCFHTVYLPAHVLVVPSAPHPALDPRTWHSTLYGRRGRTRCSVPQACMRG